MNWKAATDDQLKSIIQHDNYCPTHLLSGVVNEMFNRNLLDGLVKSVIMRNFRKIDIAVQVLKMPEADLFQFCRMKIFEFVSKYKTGFNPFLYFAFIRLRGELNDLEDKAKAEKRKVYDSIQSLNVENNEDFGGEGNDYIDIWPSNMNVEREVIRKISLEEKMQPLSDSEKECFLLYAKGYTGSEIGEKVHCSRRTAERKINSALSKMIGEKTSIKKLGLFNCGEKGA